MSHSPDLSPSPNWPRWLTRATCCFATFLAGGGALLALTVGQNPVTPLRWLTAVTAGVCALVGLVITLAPARMIDRLHRGLRNVLAALERAPVCQSRSAGLLLIMTGWGSGLGLLGIYLATPNDGHVGDQGAYLETAQWINTQGGLLKLPSLMLDGTYPESNRHPLFIALLSLVPEFTAGRWLSAGFGLLWLALTGVLTARRYGLLASGIATVLLATNKLFLLSSSRMVCESILGLLCLWTWWRTLPEQATDSSTPPTPDKAISLSRAAELGLLGGLIWLTKGTGLVIALALGVWWMGHALPRWQRALSGAAILAVAFLLTGSLLIARNLSRFDEPFYNLNSLLLFADQYEELDGMLAEGIRPGEAAHRYLETHSAADIVRRGLSGLIWEVFILIRSMGPAPWGDERLVFGLPLVLLGLTTLAVQREFRTSVFPLWLVLLIPMFGWYVPIAAGDRFLVPLVGGLVSLAAVGLARIPGLIPEHDRQQKLVWLLTAGLVVWCLLSVGLTWSTGPNEFSPG